MIRTAVIGYGYWGPNLIRNLAELADSTLAGIADARADRQALARRRYPTVRVVGEASDLIADATVDAIVIATPTSTHYALALEALQAGKHVLVEKPLAATSDEARRLIDEAARRSLILMVDHTFVYTSAVQAIKELVSTDQLGELYYYDSVRVNLGLFQHDVDVLWDLAVHDLAIMDFVLPTKPYTVSAVGMRHIGDHADIAYLTLLHEDALIAHVHVNWLAPVKIRRTLVGGSRKMIVFDDVEPSEKLKIFDKGVSLADSAHGVYEMMVNYRLGDIWSPRLALTEALATELEHFLRCIDQGSRPVTDGEAGLRVVTVLEAATQSMANGGQPIELNPTLA